MKTDRRVAAGSDLAAVGPVFVAVFPCPAVGPAVAYPVLLLSLLLMPALVLLLMFIALLLFLGVLLLFLGLGLLILRCVSGNNGSQKQQNSRTDISICFQVSLLQ